MSKTRWLLGLALLVVVVALIFSFSRLNENTINVVKHPLTESGQTPTGVAYDIQVEYPELVGRNTNTIRSANEFIAAAARTEVEKFKANIAEPLSEMSATSSLTGGYQLSQITSNRLSFEMNYLADLAGAAHPSNYTVTINYDLARGRALKITDIIGTSPEALNRLSASTSTLSFTIFSIVPVGVFAI
jgi:hypothetical protein